MVEREEVKQTLLPRASLYLPTYKTVLFPSKQGYIMLLPSTIDNLTSVCSLSAASLLPPLPPPDCIDDGRAFDWLDRMIESSCPKDEESTSERGIQEEKSPTEQIRQGTGIIEVTPADVLCGRGKSSIRHGKLLFSCHRSERFFLSGYSISFLT